MKKVLVVDDDVFIRRMIEIRLKAADVNVIEAENGEEAVEKTISERPDLIIMDIMMPQMDGFQACEAIRSNTKISGTPILMLTARGQQIDLEKAMALGILEYITKPFSPKELAKKVVKILNAVKREA
ncbi:MAG TPA: response regulator [Thermodesulfobacteriota bacterium]|nr:response regulator [Thermodesulfobacteriota bacterium]